MARGVHALTLHNSNDPRRQLFAVNPLRSRFSFSEACLADVAEGRGTGDLGDSKHAHEEPQLQRPRHVAEEAEGGDDVDDGWCIRGVPDDLILDILSRVPWAASFSLRHVSHAWQRALRSDALRAVRASRGALEQWLFVLPEFPTGGPFLAFDPNSATWHQLPRLPVADPGALEGFACAAAAGKLFVIGGAQKVPSADGKDIRTVITPTVWEFEVATWQWRAAPPLATARSWCAAAVLEDRYVLVTGGQGSQSFLKSAELYDVRERTWRAIADMCLARCSHRAVVVEGKVVAIAGEIERHDSRALALMGGHIAGAGQGLLNPLGPQQQQQQQLRQLGHDRAGRVHQLPGLHGAPQQQQQERLTMHLRGAPGARFMGAAPRYAQPMPFQSRAAQQGNSVDNASLEVYDSESDSWVLVPDSWLNSNKVPCPVASVAGSLYAVHHSSVLVWDKENASWHNRGDTPGRDAYCRPIQVVGLGCAELNGKLVLFGGTRDMWVNRTRLTQQHLSSVYMWDPEEGAGTGLQGVPQGPPVRMEVGRGPAHHNSIMLWKEMPPMVGASGRVLASAVVTV